VPWRYLLVFAALLICFVGGGASVILASRRKSLARDRGIQQVEGMAEIVGQASFSVGLIFIAAINFSLLSGLTMVPPNLAIPVACALILVLVLGVQLGRLLLRYQLSPLPGKLNTVTGEIETKAQ
jgi:hypothetical protein